MAAHSVAASRGSSSRALDRLWEHRLPDVGAWHSAQREYSVRSALGIGRLALIWQASLENLLVALGGAALGVGLAFGLTNVLKVIGGHAIPRLDGVSAGWPILCFSLAAALLSAALAGLVPVLRASRVDAAEVLKSAGPKSSTGKAEQKFLRAVTVAQTALTLALLVGAGLLVRTMKNISDVHAGYDISRILTMSVTAVQGNWSDFHHRALERVSAVPGVQYAAFAWGVPLTGNNWPATVEIEGQPLVSKQSDRLSLPLRSVTQDYFRLMGMSMLDGRPFRVTDADKSPQVAIVNRTLADRYFPHQNAIGKKLWLSGRDKPSNQIVGVVKTAAPMT